jgi:acyl carrier protein
MPLVTNRMNVRLVKGDCFMEKIYELLNNLRPELDYRDSQNFIEDGMLDSFDVVALVTDLEEAYDIKIDGLDIVPDNFVTVQSIADLIRKNGGEI